MTVSSVRISAIAPSTTAPTSPNSRHVRRPARGRAGTTLNDGAAAALTSSVSLTAGGGVCGTELVPMLFEAIRARIELQLQQR